MKVYIITYDIKLAWLRNYNPLFKALMSFPNWMHHMDNTWFIVTNNTPTGIYNKLQPHLFADSRILIAQVTSSYFGLLSQDAWDWLEKYKHLM